MLKCDTAPARRHGLGAGRTESIFRRICAWRPRLYDKRRILGWGFTAWLAGMLASVPFWLSAYSGPFAASHASWGNLNMYVGFAAAALVYLATYRLKPLWTINNARAQWAAAGALRAGEVQA